MLDEIAERRIDSLLSEMTLEEKVSMAAGSGLWFSTGVPRVGIPAYKVSDGPNGVRGEARAGVRSAAFPVGVCLAATWDVELAARVGDALADECIAKDVQVLLGPTINLQRNPLAGRNFECYSEDPHLSAELAVVLVRAVQRRGIGCCVKHFVCNDSEFERMTISSEVDERTLREVYLAPFERVVKEAGVWAIMSAYNRVNGTYASAHRELLRDVLKGEWGFDGVVISDWGGTYDTIGPANAGLDLEMPGPARHMGDKLLVAVRSGEVDIATIDDKVRRHLRLLIRTGRLDRLEPREERSIDARGHRELIRRVAADGMVLLKNDGLLPITASQRIALLGPNAAAPQILGGGSSTVLPHRVVSAHEGLRDAFPHASIEVVRGCIGERYLPLVSPAALRVPNFPPSAEGSDRAGMRVSLYRDDTFAGEPVRVSHPRRSELLWFGGFDPSLTARFAARIEAELVPNETGAHRLSLVSAGASRLFVNDRLVVDNWTSQEPGDAYFGAGSAERIGTAQLTAGEPVSLTVEFRRGGDAPMVGVRIGHAPPSHRDDIDAARQAAARADVAVLVVGLNPDWETEGHDRRDLDLPGKQVELIEAVADANPNTVVVVNSGSPICFGSWLSRVRAVLQCWYPGQEMGHALADVLSGRVNPSAKLPMTVPRRLADTPTYLDSPGEGGVVRYGERVFIGHRYYDRRGIEPEFPFGHGLSYTTFALGEAVHASRDGDRVTVGIDVTNTGERAGSEVVQVYVTPPASAVARPDRELKGFTKIHLQPHETKRISITLQMRALAYFDTRRKDWSCASGVHALWVGPSSRGPWRTGVVDLGAE
jgi:beta-glucosidase